MNEQSGTAPEVGPGLWRAVVSYGLWALCFTALYTAHALGCTAWDEGLMTRGGSEGMPDHVRGMLILLWAGFLMGMFLLVLRSRRQYRHQAGASPFMTRFTYLADASAVIITLASGLPVVLTPACT